MLKLTNNKPITGTIEIDGATLTVKPITDESYLAANAKISRYHQAQKQLMSSNTFDVRSLVDVSDTDQSDISLQAELLAKYIVTDWSGVGDEDGNEVAYTPELGKQLLRSNAIVFSKVVEEATKLSSTVKQRDQFNDQVKTGIKKKSKK